MRILTGNGMRAAEKAAVENGDSYEALMERAGKGAAEKLMSEKAFLSAKDILLLLGKGNNGGDGLVILRYISEKEA